MLKVRKIGIVLLLVWMDGCTQIEHQEPQKAESQGLLFPAEITDKNGGSEAALLSESGYNLQEVPSLNSSNPRSPERVSVALIPPDGLSDPNARGKILPLGPDPFKFRKLGDGRLELRENEEPVLVYNFGTQSKSGIPEDRNRSSYFHPIYDLKGNILTDDFPEDHHHHRGLSWMWPNVWVGGKSYDLWHIRGIRQQFEEWLFQETGPVCSTFGVRNSWVTEEKAVLSEWVWMRVYRKSVTGRIMDLSLYWQPLDERITLRGADQRSYGGLCFRLAERKEPVITSPQGVMESDSDLIPLEWADQTGLFGKQDRSGVTIIQHPQNRDFPAGWCLRYYGFIGVSWPGDREISLDPGQILNLRFRIWIHQGENDSKTVEKLSSAFGNASWFHSLGFRSKTAAGPPIRNP